MFFFEKINWLRKNGHKSKHETTAPPFQNSSKNIIIVLLVKQYFECLDKIKLIGITKTLRKSTWLFLICF